MTGISPSPHKDWAKYSTGRDNQVTKERQSSWSLSQKRRIHVRVGKQAANSVYPELKIELAGSELSLLWTLHNSKRIPFAVEIHPHSSGSFQSLSRMERLCLLVYLGLLEISGWMDWIVSILKASPLEREIEPRTGRVLIQNLMQKRDAN